MKTVLQSIPLFLAWFGMVVSLARYFSGRGRAVTAGSAIGFCAGVAGGVALLATVRGDLPFSIIKCATGGSFILFWVAAVAALYRATGRVAVSVAGNADGLSAAVVNVTACSTGLLAGALTVSRLVPQEGGLSLFPLVLMIATGVILSAAAVAADRVVPPIITVTSEALLALVISLLLFMSACSLRLDLFAPLTMKVMKFVHDFVHQIFESLLIPDHLFFRPDVWTYIGYLFGRRVGFWGGVVVWFAPALLVVLAIRLERLPSVAHIRQGAKRRQLLAAFMWDRRCRLIGPGFAVFILAAAVYQSSFPNVEYWDPRPVHVAINSFDKVFIPKKAEIDLVDGKLHKFFCKKGNLMARFIVLMTPDGRLTVTLDACAICKPQGYGQAAGSVICYYCNTLIPLETVGKPGGCNPVPIAFEENEAGVTIDAMTLLNRWRETVTAGSRIEGGGK